MRRMTKFMTCLLENVLSGRISVRAVWTTLGILVILPLVVASSHWAMIGCDGFHYYAPLRSLMIDHDLNFTNEFRDFNPYHHYVGDYTKKTATGLVACKYPIGTAILWTPFFILAHAIALLLHMIGSPVVADGYSRPYQMVISLGTALYGLIGLFLIYKILCRHYSKAISTASVFLIATATNVYYHLILAPAMWCHICSMFSVSLFVWLVVAGHHRITIRRAFCIGLALGLMSIVRNQNAVLGIFLLYEFINPQGRPALNRYLVVIPFFIAGLAVPWVPQMVFWKIIFGSFFVYTYPGEKFDFLHPHYLQVLFSMRRGLITWTPMVAFCLAGLFLFARHKNLKLGLLAIAAFLFHLIIVSNWWCWWYGPAFGQRLMADISVVFALGLAAFLEKISTNQRQLRAFSFVCIVLIAWNMFFSALFPYIGRIPFLSNYLGDL